MLYASGGVGKGLERWQEEHQLPLERWAFLVPQLHKRFVGAGEIVLLGADAATTPAFRS
jgi:hypothetical protein